MQKTAKQHITHGTQKVPNKRQQNNIHRQRQHLTKLRRVELLILYEI